MLYRESLQTLKRKVEQPSRSVSFYIQCRIEFSEHMLSVQPGEAPCRGDGMPSELQYSVQCEMVKESICEETWDRLNCDTRRYLLNLSHHIEVFFMYETIPPGGKDVHWKSSERIQFVDLFRQWRSQKVDPQKHWSLFSLLFPHKTGNQCRNYYSRCSDFSLAERQAIQEDPATVRHFRMSAFKIVCQALIPEHPHEIATVNSAANAEACQELAWEHETGQTLLRQETCLEDKLRYIEYPGTGCVVGQSQCYAAVVLQFLVRLDELVDLASLQLIARKSQYLKEFLDLRYQIETPGPLLSINHIVALSGISPTDQQDVHEFLLLVLGKMREEFEYEYASIFSDLFQTTVQYKNRGVIRRETFVNLEVQLDGVTDLERAVLKELEHCEIITSSRLLVIYVIRTQVDRTSDHFHVHKVMDKIRCKEHMDLTVRGAGIFLCLELFIMKAGKSMVAIILPYFSKSRSLSWLMARTASLSKVMTHASSKEPKMRKRLCFSTEVSFI